MTETATVWVTGANGFIGQQLVRELSASGAFVVGFGRGAGTPANCDLYIKGALCNGTFSQALELGGSPARVYHFAGGSTVGASIASPLNDFDSNVATTASLLEFLRCQAPGAGFLLASSAAVYGAGHRTAVTAESRLSPLSPYGQHKRIAEQLVHSYAENFGLRGTVLRIFSIYGPSIRKQLLYDVCFRLAGGEAPLVLSGTGDEVRDWLHVEDAVRSIVAAIDPDPGVVQVYNVASGTGTNIRTVASLVCAAWGSSSPRFSGVVRSGDPQRLFADPSSLLPNFVPEIQLADGLRDFVRQFKLERSRDSLA